MIIAVCGGRQFGDIATLQCANPLGYRNHPQWPRREAEYDFIFRTLDLAAAEFSRFYRPKGIWKPRDIKIVSGAASGADTAAIDWAKDRGAQWVEYPAEWERYGRAAGPIRNQQILDSERPELLIAFPGFTGTRDMVDRARRSGIEYRLMKYMAAVMMEEKNAGTKF